MRDVDLAQADPIGRARTTSILIGTSAVALQKLTAIGELYRRLPCTRLRAEGFEKVNKS
jgi:hypothetical protein